MARKVSDKAPAGKPAAGTDDLAILQPDGQVTIAGEDITVREYRFFEGLRLQTEEKPFFDDLCALLSQGPAPTFDDVLRIVSEHSTSVVSMVALSCDRPFDWVEGLGEADGDALLLTWWQVNSAFFIRRVMRRALQKRFEESPPDGRASTTR
jgi:hypothetical protein